MIDRVLVLNAGSSTLKWSRVTSLCGSATESGTIEWANLSPDERLEKSRAVLERVGDVDAIGHRVVHGGDRFRSSVLVTDEVRSTILALSSIDPLHAASAVAGIDAARALYPETRQVAAFDTTFHFSMPEKAKIYAVDWQWTERWSLRRFGFHGLSVAYAIARLAEWLEALPRRVVVCHLGSGCSITAVLAGKSVDTTMGFTPLEGVMMATRSGSIDPGLLFYLLRENAGTSDELERALQTRSGLLGVSGISSDLRDVMRARKDGVARAVLAYDMLVYSVQKGIGQMVAALGGVDVLVFTGGMGEHSSELRADVASSLGFCGVRVDRLKNANEEGADADISEEGASARTVRIEAREDLAIFTEVKQVLEGA